MYKTKDGRITQGSSDDLKDPMKYWKLKWIKLLHAQKDGVYFVMSLSVRDSQFTKFMISVYLHGHMIISG